MGLKKKPSRLLAAVVPLPVPPEAGVKKPDAGKGVAVLNPAVKQATGDVKMAAGWAQAIRDKMAGQKKAQSARRKSDKSDKAKAAAIRSRVVTTPAAPFAPRVQLSGIKVSRQHPINPLKIKPPKGSAIAPTGGLSFGQVETALTTSARFAERQFGAASASRAIALCGGPGSGVPGPCATGEGSHHERGQQAAAGALSTAGKWFGGTSTTHHESGQATKEARAGAHDHLTAQGFQKTGDKSIFGAPNGIKSTYSHPDGRTASIITSYLTGHSGDMSIQVKK